MPMHFIPSTPPASYTRMSRNHTDALRSFHLPAFYKSRTRTMPMYFVPSTFLQAAHVRQRTMPKHFVPSTFLHTTHVCHGTIPMYFVPSTFPQTKKRMSKTRPMLFVPSSFLQTNNVWHGTVPVHFVHATFLLVRRECRTTEQINHCCQEQTTMLVRPPPLQIKYPHVTDNLDANEVFRQKVGKVATSKRPPDVIHSTVQLCSRCLCTKCCVWSP